MTEIEDPEPDGEGIQPFASFRPEDGDPEGIPRAWYIVLLGKIISGPYGSREACSPELERVRDDLRDRERELRRGRPTMN